MRPDNRPTRTKRYLAGLFCCVSLAIGWAAVGTNAQTAGTQAHGAKAKAAAYEPGSDFTVLYDYMCGPVLPKPDVPPGGETPPGPLPRSFWYTGPAKVFDNLYFIGTSRDSAWA